jgi:hypothetical protein
MLVSLLLKVSVIGFMKSKKFEAVHIKMRNRTKLSVDRIVVALQRFFSYLQFRQWRQRIATLRHRAEIERFPFSHFVILFFCSFSVTH